MTPYDGCEEDLATIFDVESCDCNTCQIAKQSWEDAIPFEDIDIDPDKVFVGVNIGGVTLYGVDIITRYRRYNMLDGFLGGWLKMSDTSETVQ
tara:strand:+ start:3575 stop:3853 length:279 start_codon:yes stop_codon:yes gene_type:complete